MIKLCARVAVITGATERYAGLQRNHDNGSAFSALPRAVPERALAKVLGLLEALLQIGMALGAVVAGVLLHALSARIALLVVGLVLPVLAIAAAPLLRRFDARLAHHDLEVELLRHQPLFEDLPMPVLDNLSARLVPVH